MSVVRPISGTGSGSAGNSAGNQGPPCVIGGVRRGSEPRDGALPDGARGGSASGGRDGRI